MLSITTVCPVKTSQHVKLFSVPGTHDFASVRSDITAKLRLVTLSEGIKFRIAQWQLTSISRSHSITFCRMTNYELLRWLVEMRSRDVGHWTLHSWASDRATVFHSVAHVACVTFSHSVTHVARLFPKLAENENRTNTSNLRWVDLYWDNARMWMYGHELFIAERNTN